MRVLTVVLALIVGSALGRDLLLPSRQNCNPSSEKYNTCRKGDLVDKSIADCYYDSHHLLETCTASGNTGGPFNKF